MSSTQKSLIKGVWTQITTTDKSGEVLHLSGKSQVVYTEATAPNWNQAACAAIRVERWV